jgi:hypothetical protein
MTWRICAVAVTVALAAAPLARAELQLAACDPGTKIDGSTAADARKKIEKAGYRNVTDLRKGCDNAWHGKAEKEGQSVNVVLTPPPEGLVLEEGE